MKFSKLVTLIAASSCLSLLADVKLPTIFSNDMILQRDAQIQIWGWADDGEKITASFKGQSVSTVAEDGKFSLFLAPLKASSQGDTLIIRGKNQINLSNVVVGDIWICSGQSNMEWKLKNSINGTEAVANSSNPNIRLYYGNTYKGALNPADDIPGKSWAICSPKSVADFSGVGYFFALEIYKDLNIPIGLISANWGGTRIEPWTAACGFATQKIYEDKYAALVKTIPGTPEFKAYQAQVTDDMKKWIADSEKAVKSGNFLPETPASILELPRLHNNQQDTVLYNSMLNPIKNFRVKGALWYQGCANLSDGMRYRDKMHALIASWRKEFNMPEMPLYFVQLAPFTYGNKFTLPQFWVAQQAFADADPNAHMAVINDIGNYKDIHPRNKHDVGHRLALLALKYTYDKKDLVADSPFFESLEADGKNLAVTFCNAKSLKTTDGKTPKYFEIAGINGVYYPAQAEIKGNKVILSSDKVDKPYMARYAWNHNVTTTLVNENNLPAGAFKQSLPLPIRDNLDKFVPEAKNMQVLYALPITFLKESNQINYRANNSEKLAGKKIKKIGYFMFLKKQNEEKYVYVTMAPFTQDVTKLGLPTAEERVMFQMIVKDLFVKSNVSTITNGNFADGNLEIWPSDYAMNNTANVSGASSEKFDFGDGNAVNHRNGFGSFQVHNFRKGEVLFALNNFRVDYPDAGIGNNIYGGHLDYTFTGASKNYQSGELLVLVETE